MPRSEPSVCADDVAYRVIGAAIEVHRQLGPGLDVSTYHQALGYELELQGLEVKARVPVPVEYKGRVVGELRLDLVVEAQLIVELKSVDQLGELHRAELVAHLQATRLELGLLINFNVALLKDGIRRVVRCRPHEGDPEVVRRGDRPIHAATRGSSRPR